MRFTIKLGEQQTFNLADSLREPVLATFEQRHSLEGVSELLVDLLAVFLRFTAVLGGQLQLLAQLVDLILHARVSGEAVAMTHVGVTWCHVVYPLVTCGVIETILIS